MSTQVALVTGASRGIGLATAIELARKGFSIAVNGIEDNAELDDALEQVRSTGAAALKAPHDISDIAGFDSMLTRIEGELGALTTLVNNAGVSVLNRGDMLDVTEESYDRCLSINTKGMFFLTQAFVRKILERHRDSEQFHSIINVTSSNAKAVATPRSEYAISKAAASMASQCWAVRLGEENIHVYDIQPGIIETDMTKGVMDKYRQMAKEGLVVLPRIGKPDEVGKVIANLASGALPYVTGQTVSVDGGMLISRF